MKQVALIITFFSALIILTLPLRAEVIFFNCPDDKQININGENWTVTESKIGSWIGTGGEKKGPWQKTNLITSDGQTEINCTYQSSEGRSQGTIKGVTPQICAFESGDVECTGNNCTIACAPASEVARLSGSCQGKNIGTFTPYNCFHKSFNNQLIVNKWTIEVKAPDCSNNGDYITASFKLQGAPICWQSSITGESLKVYENRDFKIEGLVSTCGVDTDITFSLSENGKCSQ
ncbi:MAG TPA: hypothetical protein VMW10_05110 [Alphaproteobacteria bacterium]|nr:hypothetical protein [Alphaproteobacteria bacterium]